MSKGIDMGIKEEFQKLGEDLFKGLRFGLGGPPSDCSTPSKKTRSKKKDKGKGSGKSKGR